MFCCCGYLRNGSLPGEQLSSVSALEWEMRLSPILHWQPLLHAGACPLCASASFPLWWEVRRFSPVLSPKAFCLEKMPSKNCYSSLYVLTKIIKQIFMLGIKPCEQFQLLCHCFRYAWEGCQRHVVSFWGYLALGDCHGYSWKCSCGGCASVTIFMMTRRNYTCHMAAMHSSVFSLSGWVS